MTFPSYIFKIIYYIYTNYLKWCQDVKIVFVLSAKIVYNDENIIDGEGKEKYYDGYNAA